jgi:carbonic anhydrase
LPPLLADILEHNARWVEAKNRPPSKVPQKKSVIFTCMDTRLVDFLEQAMGVGRGDAKFIKNAGNTVIDPGGGVVRSILVALYALECSEVFVIGHTDCGMAQLDESVFMQRMLARGVSAEAIASLKPSLREWLGAFHDPLGNVQRVVELLQTSPLIPRDVPVHGLMFDPVAGELRLVVNGYQNVPPTS